VSSHAILTNPTLQRAVRSWKAQRERDGARVFIPLVFAPGEAYQFDWSYETVELGGQVQAVKVAHLRLAHSRVFLVVAYLREAQEMVFDAHWRAFRLWGGVPRRGIYDNLKTAVDLIFAGKQRQYNRRFLQMASHYLIEPVACTPAAGGEGASRELRSPGPAGFYRFGLGIRAMMLTPRGTRCSPSRTPHSTGYYLGPADDARAVGVAADAAAVAGRA
jgi:hypothetical protein